MNGFERRKELKKNNILKTSLKLFITNGVQNVPISQIAKDADVSQVTIYNYFGSKEALVQDVIIFYVKEVWKDFEQLMDSNLLFPEKIKQSIFNKTDSAVQINEEFFGYFMEAYTSENSTIKVFYEETVFPRLIEFFDEGKEQGYIDSSLSNEAVLVFIQMFINYLQQEKDTTQLLPLTEDLTKLFFYGIVGESDVEE